jgi:hypothetical protein
MTNERYLRMIAGFFVMASVAGLLGESQLVSVHRLRGAEPVSIGIHQLVPSDDVAA